jgi:ADP-ribose pyrophosphatase
VKFHKLVKDAGGWDTLESETVFSNPYLEVRIEKVKTPTRPEGALWTVAHRKGATVVAPITPEGRLVLVQQERIPIRADLWEFPAGQIDESDEHDDAIKRATVIRELREEAGYDLGPESELVPMGLFFSSAGFMDEHSHLFAATNVIPSAEGRAPEESESFTGCRAFSPDEFREMIASGEIRDANTLAAFARMVVLGVL